ncbi:homer protein homolog 2-like isoform X2 [Paramacrobiotus metropolitanus]|uniref:homer protein homolog 2-like isoform X2 n=1 Tax=Paramacrobiotus metropolitanus TaxID=2943436 RepID=UPI00244562D0|nr:homer protein homolog 2-like isoform X2 [Paramacrobiotus metropolitanus]
MRSLTTGKGGNLFWLVGALEQHKLAEMTLNSDSMMGEQPLLSVKAHVYHIDPKSKKSWIPATGQAVPVSFFFDSSRNLYRIISVEGTKAVINSIVTPAMSVTKTSQKFLQWSDSRANMVYGLGFAKEEDLSLFLEKFKEVKMLSVGQKGDGGLESGQQSNGPGSLMSVSQVAVMPRSASPPSSASSNSSPRPPPLMTGSVSATPTIPPTGQNQGTLNESQLRVENEKLREALAKSSANADKWKIQLKSLEDEKQKLLKALEESHANLSRWETEVSVYRTRVAELEHRKGGINGEGSVSGEEGGSGVKMELERLKGVVLALEKRNQAKDAEISNLTARLDELRTMESDNRALKLAISDMQEKLSRQVALNENLRSELRLLRTHVSRQLTDWKKMDEKLNELISSNPSS